MIQLRCSGLPLALACAPSLTPPTVRIANDDAAARLGTSTHTVVSALIRGEPWDVQSVADADGVDGEQLGMLVALAMKAWKSIKHYFPDPLTEYEMRHEADGIELTGHADVVAMRMGTVYGVDFKTGFADVDHSQQMMGYGFLALQESQAASVRWAVVHVREQEITWCHWTRDELNGWWHRLVNHVRAAETYRPGRWCGYCPRANECPARGQMVRQQAEALSDWAHWPTKPNDLELGQLYDRAKQVEQMASFALDYVRATVQARGGNGIGISGNRALVLREQTRREIDYRLAAEFIKETLGEDALAECSSIDKASMDQAVKQRAGRGQKTAALYEHYIGLTARGAVTTKTITKLECKHVGTDATAIPDAQHPALAAEPTGGASD